MGLKDKGGWRGGKRKAESGKRSENVGLLSGYGIGGFIGERRKKRDAYLFVVSKPLFYSAELFFFSFLFFSSHSVREIE